MWTKRKNRNQHFVLVMGIILISILGNNLRDVPKYYKNMLYVSSFNTIYYFLCRRHLVWEFIPSGINWWVIRLVHIFIVTPILILMFLSKMPSELIKQLEYILKWITISTVVEYFAQKRKLILYAHGWNIFWSSLLYFMMYTYSYLYSRRPSLTLVLSMCSTVFYVIKFKVPLRLKHYSRYFEPLIDVYYHTFLEDFISKKTRKLF
jgi:hypothetical protein